MVVVGATIIMKNHLSKSPPLNELDFVSSASTRATSSSTAAGAVQSRRRLRNRSISDGTQKKSQSPVDPSILSVLDEDEITSSFSSVDQFGRMSPGTPPKKLWERQYNSFLRNRNNNRSTENVASSHQHTMSGLSSSPNSQDSAVRGGKFFSSVFRAGPAEASAAGKTKKNASTDELDGTMRRGADKSYYSPRNTQAHHKGDSIPSNMNTMPSGNMLQLPNHSPRSRDGNIRGMIQPKILSTEDGITLHQAALMNGSEDDFPPYPPLLIPPRNMQTASRPDQGTISLEKLIQAKCSTGSSINGTLKSPNPSRSTIPSVVTTTNPISESNADVLQPASSVTESAMKKAFTKIRHLTDADVDSAYLGDDPSVSSRQILFAQKNEQLLIQHSERISHGQKLLDQQQHRRSQTNLSGVNVASLEPVHEDSVSIKSSRLLRAISGVETWETGRRYLIGPAALAACPTAALNSLLKNSCTTPIDVSKDSNVATDGSNSTFETIILGECLLSYITDTPTKQWTSAKLVLRQNYLLEYDSGADIQAGVPRGFAHLEGATTILHEHFRDALVLHFFGSPCAKTDARSLMIRIRHSTQSASFDDSIHLHPEIRKAWQRSLNRAASLTKIGDMYEYDESNVLGKGQYAEVRAARRLRENQSGKNGSLANATKPGYDCAIKIFNKDKFWRMVVKGRERADTIVRETSIQATLLSRCPDNNAFLRIRGFFETSKYVVLELELLESTDLFKYVTSKVVLKESEAAVILRDILRCLIDMSKIGMAHRDIKPANILICGGNEQASKGENITARMSAVSAHIKVCDFGMATFVGVDGQVRGRCGTPGYVAPEIFTAGTYGGYGNKVDVFSAGVTLYVMLSGYEPFYGETDDQLKEANRAAIVEFPSEDWSNISKEAVELVTKMMHPDPAMRLDARQALNHPWIDKNIPQSMLNDTVQDSTESYDQDSSCVIS